MFHFIGTLKRDIILTNKKTGSPQRRHCRRFARRALGIFDRESNPKNHRIGTMFRLVPWS